MILIKLKPILIISFTLIIGVNVFCSQNISILFISSYSPNFPTFIEQYNGIKEVFSENDAKLQLEFLNTKQYPEGEIHTKIEETIVLKLEKNSNYDLVITADDNALHFIDKYYHLYFYNIPVVFFGVNNEEFALKMGEKPNITGIIEDISITKNLKLIEKIFPNKTLYIISDNTESGKSDLKRVYENISSNNYSFKTKFLDLKDISWFELEKVLLEKSTDPILLLSAYKDKNNENKSFKESIKLIMASYNGAAFHFWKHGLQEGMIGGNLVDHYQYAKQAARIGKFILIYKKKPRLNVTKAENSYIINYEVMKKLKLKSNNFPEETNFIKKPIKSFEIYEDYFIFFIITLISFFILLFIQIQYIMKKKE